MEAYIPALIGLVGTVTGAYLTHYFALRRERFSSKPKAPSRTFTATAGPKMMTATPALQPPVSKAATASLLLGLFGWTYLPVISAIAAIVVGQRAKKEIEKSAGRIAGARRAKAGVILGILQLALFVLILI